MNYQGYGEHISQEIINNFPYGAAIFTDRVAKLLAEQYLMPFEQAKKITNVYLKRIADRKEIERFQKGVYYRAKQTVFGKTKPNLDAVTRQLLMYKNDEVIGYETGAAFLHRLGLSTLMPRAIEIASNSYRKKISNACHIVVKRPVININGKNYKYLQFIDAVAQISDSYIDAENPRQILLNWLHDNELNKEYLIYYAKKYYSAKILHKLIDIILEVENEVT